MGQVTLNKLLRYKPDNDHGDDEETNFFQGLVASILVGEVSLFKSKTRDDRSMHSSALFLLV